MGESLVVLGVDPGTAIVGFAFLKIDLRSAAGALPEILDYGCIRTAKDARPRRLRLIHDALSSLMKRHAPDVVAVERVFFQKNVRTAMAVGEAQGVIMLAAAERGVDVVEYTPSQVKQALTGDGRASKHDMQFMVQGFLDLPYPARPDDVADALAIALCHISYLKLGLADLPARDPSGALPQVRTAHIRSASTLRVPAPPRRRVAAKGGAA